MQAYFISYILKFVNLELRYKLKKVYLIFIQQESYTYLCYLFTIFNITKMQAQFVSYILKFVNLELRYKLTRILIRLLIKNKKLNQAD